MDRLELLNTLWVLIVPSVFSSFGIFLCRQFVYGIPVELYDAAKIDGAGDFTIYTRIIVGMMKPVISVLAIFQLPAPPSTTTSGPSSPSPTAATTRSLSPSAASATHSAGSTTPRSWPAPCSPSSPRSSSSSSSSATSSKASPSPELRDDTQATRRLYSSQMPIMIQQNAKCISIPFTHVAHQWQPSLTTDYWPLTTAVPGGRAYSALPCAGAPPPQRPLSCSRRSECVGNTKFGDPRRRARPPSRVLAGPGYVPAQAGQARQRPIGPNVFSYHHQEPATQILAVHSGQTDRTQDMAW